MRGVVLLGVLSACGRFGFDPADPPDSTDSTASCPTGAILCDDFETGDISKWTRKVIGSTGIVTTTATVVHSGTTALQLQYPGGPTSGAAAVAFARAVSSGTLAVREWVQSPAPLTKFNLVMTETNNVTGQFITAGGNNSALWVSSEQNAGGMLVDHPSSVATAVTQWTCVETVITIGAPSQVELFVDGTQVVSATLNDASPAYTETQVGLTRADQGGDTLFVDDVVIATSRIGCN